MSRGRAPTPHWVADAAGDPIEVGGHCGLHVDMQLEAAAPMRGDWVARPADDLRWLRARLRPRWRLGPRIPLLATCTDAACRAARDEAAMARAIEQGVILP